MAGLFCLREVVAGLERPLLVVAETSSDSNVFYTRVNLFSGEVGNYEFVGHDGASPELTVEIGKTYLFDQTHHTNWYHPLGKQGKNQTVLTPLRQDWWRRPVLQM